MSLMHSIVFYFCKKGKRHYEPGRTQDYEASRLSELRQNRFAQAPRSVRIEERRLGGVPVELLSRTGNPYDRVVLYIHGGGFVVGSVKTRRAFTGYVVGKLGFNVAAVEYRLAPEHPFPAAPEDCFAVYRELLREYRPGNIVLLGESAGGCLVLSVLLQIKAAGLPMPAAALCFSPCVQFDRVLPSYTGNEQTEAMVENLSEEVFDTYLRSNDAEKARDPIFAPYYGDFTGCPPIYLWASESELLRDDSVILYEKLRAEGRDCNLYLRGKMLHTWLIIPYIPEARADLKRVKTCIDNAFSGVFRSEPAAVHLERYRG